MPGTEGPPIHGEVGIVLVDLIQIKIAKKTFPQADTANKLGSISAQGKAHHNRADAAKLRSRIGSTPLPFVSTSVAKGSSPVCCRVGELLWPLEGSWSRVGQPADREIFPLREREREATERGAGRAGAARARPGRSCEFTHTLEQCFIHVKPWNFQRPQRHFCK